MPGRICAIALLAVICGVGQAAAQQDVYASGHAGDALIAIVTGPRVAESSARQPGTFALGSSVLLEEHGATGDVAVAVGRAPTSPVESRRSLTQAPPAGGRPSWIRRHPVLFGAIVGAGTGAVVVGHAVDMEASPIGFFGGGGAGALVGWAVSR